MQDTEPPGYSAAGLGHLVQGYLSPDALGTAYLGARSWAPGLPEPPAARLWGLDLLSSETPWEEPPRYKSLSRAYLGLYTWLREFRAWANWAQGYLGKGPPAHGIHGHRAPWV